MESTKSLEDNLSCLHDYEEQMRQKAITLIGEDPHLYLHVTVVERTMNLADVLRQFPTDDEDLKVVLALGMRMFNAFGAGLKLALSGYAQNSILIMRDILETVFLLDLFESDRSAITRWRLADKKERKKNFSPIRVRELLDKRDGFTTKRRFEHYELMSELAGHPTMKSIWMLRPQKNGDAVIGPFIEKTTLEANLSEIGRLAIQAGDLLDAFFPKSWNIVNPVRKAWTQSRDQWVEEFYGGNLHIDENSSRSE
jgi:hypothetical protein